jgi:hypothetical protein
MMLHDCLAFFKLIMPNLGAASTEIGKSLRKIRKIPPKVCESKQELICVFQVVHYLCDILCPTFKMTFR